MPTQIVMDRSGDRRHEFDAESVSVAEKRFIELTQRGFVAFELGKDGGDNRLLKTFDPNAERTVFVPQLVGG